MKLLRTERQRLVFCLLLTFIGSCLFLGFGQGWGKLLEFLQAMGIIVGGGAAVLIMVWWSKKGECS